MHRASIVLAAGADFRLLGPRSTMLASPKPVVAVCATRTGAGKSPTSRPVRAAAPRRGERVALVRHPMPYGDLERMRVQRSRTAADIDAARPTIEEEQRSTKRRSALGIVVYAGVDYAAESSAAAAEADVIVWDGGNDDCRSSRRISSSSSPIRSAPATSSATTRARPTCEWPERGRDQQGRPRRGPTTSTPWPRTSRG